MRSLFGIFLLALTVVPSLSAQESKKGFELNFSVVYPAKWNLNEYKFSADPTLEILYYNAIFWELSFGLKKTLIRKGNFALSLSPYAGYRKESPKKFHETGYYNYFFYGLGVSTRFGK